jgi:aminopeptidase YwaD
MTRYRIFAVCLIAFFSLPAKSQDLQRVRHTIDTLTSPYMAGRGYVTAGDQKAATYIKERFAAVGLKPLAPGYLQHFTLPINTFPGQLSLKIGNTTLIPGQDFIADPISGEGSGNGRVLILDTTIFDNAQARQQFLKRNISGHVLVYHRRHYARLAAKPADVLRKIYEAKAVVELQDGKLTASLAGWQAPVPVYKVKQEAFAPNTRNIRFATDARLVPDYQSQNVLGYIPGTHQPDSFVVITAHYDHLGQMGPIYFPGANDNASGVSMMLELAHYYAKNPPRYSIAFIGFGAEEAGLIGSEYYTMHPAFPLSQIKFLLNLDLLGTGDDGLMVVNGAVHAPQFSILDTLNEQQQLLPALRKRGRAANSDHFHFSEKGVPAFFFYTMGGIAAYHDIYDRPETLPLTKYKEVFNLIEQFIKQLQ